MGHFKNWLESWETDKEDKLRELFNKSFDFLKISGLGKDEVMNKSLEEITKGSKDTPASTVRTLLKPITDALEQYPELKSNVTALDDWLGTTPETQGQTVAPKKTLKDLMDRLFGRENVHKWLGDKSPEPTAALQKAPPQPPDATAGGNNQPPTPPQPPQPDPNAQTPGQQPQMPPMPPQMQPTNPPQMMPPVPEWVRLGLF